MNKLIERLGILGLLAFSSALIYGTYREVNLNLEQKVRGEQLLEQKVEEQLFDDNTTEVEEEAQLFNYDNLKEVDFSEKVVRIDVYIDDSEFSKSYKKNREEIFKQVSNFYGKMNVILDINFVDSIDYLDLKPAEHLAIEILPQDKWMQRNYEILNLDSDLERITFYARHLLTSGRAYIDKNICLINCGFDTKNLPKNLQEMYLIPKISKIKVSNKRIVSNIIHEIGHLFGLYHSHDFSDDLVPDYLEINTDIPNFMSYMMEVYCEEFPEGAGFNKFQEKVVHSYLSKGLVFKQWDFVDFNFRDYTSKVKSANNYEFGRKKI